MIEKLQYLQPEIALFSATCVVLLLGLSSQAWARKSCAPLAGVALIIAAWLGLHPRELFTDIPVASDRETE